MSIIISDENRVLISTGTFQDFNNKGFVINDFGIASMFKEYAKILAVTSKRVRHQNFGQYFSLSSYTKSIPPYIEEAISRKEYSSLKNACLSFVEEELNLINSGLSNGTKRNVIELETDEQ